MMNEKYVRDEIRKFISDKIDANEIIVVDWITTEILKARCSIEGSDAPFYLACARKFVQDAVRNNIKKYDPQLDTAADRDVVFPGFEYLQCAYTFERDGRATLIPIGLLSDRELSARAHAYDEMAKGCRSHANEIRQFVRTRSQSARASA